MIDAVEVAMTGRPAAGVPWLRFDLVLQHCCTEPNTVVFEPGDDGVAATLGDPPAFLLSGPACAAPVTCTGATRTVALGGPGPLTLDFEITPIAGADALLAGTTFVSTLTPTFDFEHPDLDDQEMAIDVRVDVSPVAPSPAGDTTPIATSTRPVTNVGGGFDLLTFPFAAVADDPAALASVLAPARRPVDIDLLDIDWSTHAAVVLAIPTDACPPLLAGIEIADGRATPEFVPAGHLSCIQPLLSHTIIATVARDLLTGADELVLPPTPSYFDDPVTAPIDITASAPATQEPPAATAPFGTLLGTADLPARGEATVTTLSDGTPVFVVRHHDGTVSALDPRAPVAYTGNDTDSQYQLVRWTAPTRILLGSGAWDEYGRRLDGFRTTDLRGYATRVVGGVVEIGSPVPPPTGSPIALTAGPPAMASLAIPIDAPIGLDEALSLPPGTTALIDATVVIDPDGAHVCAAVTATLPVTPCPDGSPTADDVPAQPHARTAWFGPLLATRTEAGFTRIAPNGGSAGSAV